MQHVTGTDTHYRPVQKLCRRAGTIHQCLCRSWRMFRCAKLHFYPRTWLLPCKSNIHMERLHNSIYLSAIHSASIPTSVGTSWWFSARSSLLPTSTMARLGLMQTFLTSLTHHLASSKDFCSPKQKISEQNQEQFCLVQARIKLEFYLTGASFFFYNQQDLVGNGINDHHDISVTVVQRQNRSVCLYNVNKNICTIIDSIRKNRNCAYF